VKAWINLAQNTEQWLALVCMITFKILRFQELVILSVSPGDSVTGE
jgi:hypothetical protein